MILNPTQHDISMLYVEDDDATREQVGRMIKTRGIRLLMAENGQEGLDLFRRHKPDIILTDIMMPLMNGLELARAIRKEAPGAQIIVMTAFSETSYLLEAIDVGINQFVVKPVDLNRLFAAIERCISVIKLEADALRAKKLEATSILAGGMAHDFNNLLQVILGYICLAKQKIDPGSPAYRLLNASEKSTEQACELSQRLLTFAKGGDSSMHSAQLEQLIVASVDAALNGTTVTSEFNLQADTPLVKIDEAQIRQVISHLTVNAIEAMPNGGTLRVAVEGCTITEQDILPLPPAEYVHVTFRDTGKGIHPENMGKIFDPYFTTKEMGSQKGMGLGLAICQAIIRKHKGILTAESQPENGATFHIYLPATKQGGKLPDMFQENALAGRDPGMSQAGKNLEL